MVAQHWVGLTAQGVRLRPHPLTPAAYTGGRIVAVVHWTASFAGLPLRQGGDVKTNEHDLTDHLVIESKAAIIDSEDVGLGVH